VLLACCLRAACVLLTRALEAIMPIWQWQWQWQWRWHWHWHWQWHWRWRWQWHRIRPRLDEARSIGHDVWMSIRCIPISGLWRPLPPPLKVKPAGQVGGVEQIITVIHHGCHLRTGNDNQTVTVRLLTHYLLASPREPHSSTSLPVQIPVRSCRSAVSSSLPEHSSQTKHHHTTH
jgi:hypothetical protein